jgi:LysR family hydrogen peroxide-inducible transcriptional activator
MELQQLRYFVAVAELGNFTRAAEKCLVAQPSLSQQIIKLERELGHPLFDRTGRTARLTDAGRQFYHQVSAVLDNLESARRSIAEDGDAGAGRVSVGAIPTVAPYLLPGLLSRFARRFPRAELAVEENLTQPTLRACLEGELDVAVVALPIDDPQLAAQPLLTEPLLLAVPARHPLVRRRRVTMDDVAREPFVLLSETHCLGQQIVSICRQRSHQPQVSCRSAQLLTVQELVAQGRGVSLIPQMAARADKTRRLKYLELADARPQRTLALVWRKNRYQSPLVKRFLEVAVQQTAEQS